jgi:predicted ATPase
MSALKKKDLFVKELKIDWDAIAPGSYLRSIKTIAGINRLAFHSPITFFVGENGTGKSTLLEAMAVAYGFNPEGGTVNYSFSTYDSHSELWDAVTLSKSFKKVHCGYFLRAESFYNVATKEDEYGKMPGGVPLNLHKKSHGESFLTIINEYFKSNGLFFLDEPEAALSPQRQMTLLLKIAESARDNSQFFIVTHSPVLLTLPGAEILSFDNGSLHKIEYEDTESYRISEMFINHREQVLKRLLES